MKLYAMHRASSKGLERSPDRDGRGEPPLEAAPRPDRTACPPPVASTMSPGCCYVQSAMPEFSRRRPRSRWRRRRTAARLAMTVEAQRATGEALRVTSESFAIATVASDADRRCRRALLEEWVGRKTASFRLPPSRLALDPGDVVQLDHDDGSLRCG